MKVLFLCTGNSARSILSEYLLRKTGAGRFEASSAGSHPTGQVHPRTLRVLAEDYGIDASDARSKGVEELRDVPFDVVVTVCDNARESCPLWLGPAVRAHWGVPDPAAVEGPPERQLQAFREAARTLGRRIERFCSLPFEELDREDLEEVLREIGDLQA